MRYLVLAFILLDPKRPGHNVAIKIRDAMGGTFCLLSPEQKVLQRHFEMAGKLDQYDRQRARIFQKYEESRVVDVTDGPKSTSCRSEPDDRLLVWSREATIPFVAP